MSDTQANTIRDLLLAALAKYDPTIPLDVGSRAYSEIISPVYDALSPDMFDTEIEEYLLKVLKEEYPSLELQHGDAIVDLLVRPLQLLLEPLKREINLLKKRQSARYVNELTIEDAEDLASNFFISRKNGSRARGVARVLLSTPTFLTITDQVRFSTGDGLVFYPLRQELISAETIALQQVGTLYYVDITVVAEQEGEEYNIDPGALSIVEGIPRYTSVSNPFAFEQGALSETKQELLTRAENSLTERSLTSKKGITARILEDFDDIREINVIGYGDPEMERDILVGSGEGDLMASGVSFVVGRYVFMVTGYEDSKGGHSLPAPGNKVKFNFWKFLYASESIEANEIQQIIYSSYGDAPDMPTVHIFLLKSDISRQPITGGALPGVYMGLFTSVFTTPSLTISGLPLGKETEDGVLPIETISNQVHIGGRYDVWARPTETTLSTSSMTIQKSQYVSEDVSVYTDGETQEPALLGRYPLNRVGLGYELSLQSHQLYPREAVRGSTSGALGFIQNINGAAVTLIRRSGSFEVNENIVGLTSGNSAYINAITITEANPDNIGSVITITEGVERTVFILDTFEDYYIVSEDIAEETYGVSAYIHSKTGVKNLFDPVFKVFPETASSSNVLQTSIGSAQVIFSADLVAEGVKAGDSLEILEGADIGRYAISSIEALSAMSSRATISEEMHRTNSNVSFRIIREESPISAPLIRIQPSGLTMSSAASNGFEIPYRKPVGAYALGAFSGAIGKYDGVNGFVLPNMDETFKGSGALISDIAKQADSAWMAANFSNASVDDCISEGCTPCNGVPVTCTVTIDGTASAYTNVKFYLSGLISTTGLTYLQNLNDWLKSVIDSYFRGVNSQNQAVADDLQAFLDAFSPITFGEPDVTNTNENIIKQFEMCIPLELFDSCNNTYLAIPEFDWPSEFESVTTFYAAISEFLSGRMKAKPTSLKYARPGDSLKIHDGANKGEYVIDKVVNIPWYNGDTVATESSIDETNTQVVTASIVESKVYDLTLVVIRGEFPNEVLKGSAEYFDLAGLPNIPQLLPTIPVQQFQTVESKFVSGPNSGVFINPFDIIEEAYSTLFKTMYIQGFDLPEEVNLQPGPVLTKIIMSLFSRYTVGNRSPQQTTRMLFQDAIDTTVYAPRVCSSISWRPEVQTPPTITGNQIGLPNALLANKTLTVNFTLNHKQTYQEFTGTLPPAAGTTTDIEELVAYIQEAIDPGSSYISVTYLASTVEPFYRITLSALQGGEGAYLEPEAYSFSDGFAQLGFVSKTWGPLPEFATNPMSPIFLLTNPKLNKLLMYNAGLASTTEYDRGRIAITNSLYCLIRIPSITGTPLSTGSTQTLTLTWTDASNQQTSVSKVVTIIASVISVNPLTESYWIVEMGTQNDIAEITSYLNDSLLTEETGTIGSFTGTYSAPHITKAVFAQLSANNHPFLNGGNPVALGTPPLLDIYYGYASFNATSQDIGTITVVGLEMFSGLNSSILIGGTQLLVDSTNCMQLTVTVTFGDLGDPPSFSMSMPSGYSAVNVQATANSEIADITSSLIAEPLPISLLPGSTTEISLNGSVVTGGVSVTIDGVTRELFNDLSRDSVIALNDMIEAAPSDVAHISVYVANHINATYFSDGFAFAKGSNTGIIYIVGGANSTMEVSLTNNGAAFSSHSSFNIFDHLTTSTKPGVSPAGTTQHNSSGTVNSVAVGSSARSTTSIEKKIHAQNGTRFSITQGAEERQLVVDIQNNEEYYSAVMPRRLANMMLPQSELKRDCVFTSHFALAESCTMFFTGTEGESALEAGVLPGDLLYLNEQVCTLDNSNLNQNPFLSKKDRLLHVRYNPTTKTASLLTTAGTFLTPESTNFAGESPPEDVVQIGDYVYFEDSGKVASVVRVYNTELVLDSDVGIPSQPPALGHGADGIANQDTFSSITYPFTPSDVGLYLVIYGSEYEGVDGTYDILSVSSGVATISETIANAETNLHFLVVKPDFTELGESSIGGFSETRGITPVRIYRGTPSIYTVGYINQYLARVSSSVEVLYGDIDGGPRRGVNQPFKILRPYEYRISAIQMQNQGLESKFYYFDVPTTTLTPTFDLNIPENTQYTPIVSTMKTYGYDLIPLHRGHVFSTREQCELIIDSSFIPKTLSGSLKNTQSPEKSSISLTYESSDTLATLQSFLTNDDNKNLCSDPLAKHFLPGYISMEITGGRSNDKAKKAIVDYIDSLSPTDSLQLSVVERELHYNSTHTYDHPIFMYCLTYDLNRDIILTRTDNYIDDDTILHDGTNRITYFIATADDILIGGS